jgi:F-type H+-transporting ATPase subunit epsilon
MAKFTLSVITPNGTFFEGDVDRLNIKTANGYLGVLANHIPLVGTIEISKMEIIDGSNRTESVISGGLLYVEKEKTVVITDAIEAVKDIDVARAKQAKERAEKRLSSKNDDIDYERAEIALAKAIARIEYAKK